MLPISIKLLHDKAIVPTQSHPYDAWYDLYSCEEYTLQPWERHNFMIWIAMIMPEWWYWHIAPRSWLAIKHGIDTLAGVVDHSYTWEICVVLINLWQEPYYVLPGDRIAQYIFSQCGSAAFTIVDELPITSRQESRFGSTGK